MNLFWRNKNPYQHKVKPPKAKPRDENGYNHFLIKKKQAIENYLALEDVWKDKKKYS